MKNLNKESKILIATFSPWFKGKRLSLNGNVEPLLDFFVPKVEKTVLIDQPYPGSDILMSRIEVYEKGKKIKILSSSKLLYFLWPVLKIFNYHATHISFKIRDFLSVIDCGLREKTAFDFFIGLEAINALAGIMLRRIGRIKKVIYYVSDYSPNRYKQKWFNNLYVNLDRYCATHVDYIWDVSKAMQPARVKAGLDPRKSAPVFHVPNALYPAQIRSVPLNKIKPFTLVFMGTLGPENGPDLAIEALSLVLKKFSKTVLHIIGGDDENLRRLKNLAEKLELNDKIIFYGFISNREEISEKIRNFSLALAPYPAFEGSPRFYGDATKIRAYLAAGLPVITTHVPPLGKDAAQKGAAILVDDNAQALGKAIIKIFSEKKLYLKLRRQAIDYAKDNTWENEFSRGFREMGKIK